MIIIILNVGSVRERSHRMQEIGVRSPVATDLSLKQVVTAPLLISLQRVRVSRVLGDDLSKRMARDTVGLAR